MPGVAITMLALGAPPFFNRIHSEVGGVVGGADENGTSVRLQIVHPVGDGDADGVRTEVVVVNRPEPRCPHQARETWRA